MDSDDWKTPLLVESHPDHPWSRKVYAFRNQLLRELRQGNRCVLLCSCWLGEGKSSLAANLAVTLSQMALRTVVVDADLAKPTLSTVLRQSDQPGLQQGLQSQPYQPIVLDRHNFSLLAAGQSEQRVALRQDVLAQVFERLRAQFDCILVDSTALSVNSDAVTLGSVTDGCFFIVQGKKFRGVPEGHFIEDLREARIPILGTLVNG